MSSESASMSCASEPLSVHEYRLELERMTAVAILNREDSGLAVFGGEVGAYALALRLLGGYGWTNFDRPWAERIIDTNGRPKLEALSWPEFPGGPVHVVHVCGPDQVQSQCEQDIELAYARAVSKLRQQIADRIIGTTVNE